MKLVKFDNVDLYYQKVGDYLLKDEAVNCLLLASCLSLCNSDRYKLPYLALVIENRNILATAIQISDRQLLLSKSSNLEAVRLIAEDMAVSSRSISGITAPQSEAELFTTAWQKLTREASELKMLMLIQQLESVNLKANAINSAAGKLRLAVSEETELLTNWIQAFIKEALGKNESKANSQQWVIRHIEQNSLYVWGNKNQPVSMAACGGKTPNGIRVNSVYTPYEYRGRGYATSCVAAMSKILLEQQQYCFLFTDTANLVSNNIYRQIGYIPMSNIKDYKFY